MKVETIADGITLYLGDCREVLPTLDGVDAVVTDPPYGIGIAANPVRQKHEKMKWDSYPPTSEFFSQMLAVGRTHIIWGGNYFDLPPSQSFLIWDKVQPEGLTLAMCEYAWANLGKPAKLFRRHVVSFEKYHPTTKPVELMKWCLLQLPEDAKIILDPFMGSGSTGVAAVSMGCQFVGIEIEQKYFDIACRRISEALRQGDLFVEKARSSTEQIEWTEMWAKPFDRPELLG